MHLDTCDGRPILNVIKYATYDSLKSDIFITEIKSISKAGLMN